MTTDQDRHAQFACEALRGLLKKAVPSLLSSWQKDVAIDAMIIADTMLEKFLDRWVPEKKDG